MSIHGGSHGGEPAASPRRKRARARQEWKSLPILCNRPPVETLARHRTWMHVRYVKGSGWRGLQGLTAQGAGSNPRSRIVNSGRKSYFARRSAAPCSRSTMHTTRATAAPRASTASNRLHHRLAGRQHIIDDGHPVTGIDEALELFLRPVALGLLANEKPLQRLTGLVIAQHGRRRHRDRPDLEPANRLNVEVAGGVVKQLAEERDRLAVEEHLSRRRVTFESPATGRHSVRVHADRHG